MSDAIKHIDVDSEEFEDAPRALRDYVKKLQSQATSLTKERDDARGQVASRAVADVLADKQFKNPERVKNALLADGIDPLDNTAVESWITANGDDYARATAGEQQAQEQQSAAVPPEEQQAHASLQVEGGAGSASKWDLVQSKITPDMRGPEIAALYKEHGI